MEQKLKQELPFGVFKKLKFDKPPHTPTISLKNLMLYPEYGV